MEFSRTLAQSLAFGSPFNRTPRDGQLATQLRSGVLELSPHKPWKMPSELTWRENPYKEPNWVAQFHMLRWLDPLRRMAQDGQAECLDTWIDIAHSWIDKNPPGRGRATYTWADMVEAARALTLCFALPVLQDLRPESLGKVLTSIHQHGEWLEDESHIRRGNHALQQHQGLLVIGAVMQRDDWVDLSIDRATRMLREVYDDDGINEEGAVQYHQINFQWWNTLRQRIEKIRGSAPKEFDRVAQAPVGMAHATRPDGNYELIGDTEVFPPRGIDHPAIRYVSSSGESGAAPAERVRVFDSGYVFGRSTWGSTETLFADALFYSLRFGPQNRIHGHVDGMALTLFNNGEQVLVDSGKYAYDAQDPYRAHLLSREGHNSVSIQGREYDKSSDVLLVRHSITDESQHFRFVDTGFHGVTMSRDVIAAPGSGFVAVIDRVEAEEEVTAQQWWHFDPEAGHSQTDSRVFVLGKRNQAHLAVANPATEVSVVKGQQSPMQGWFSPTWRKRIPTRTMGVSARGTSLLIPTAIWLRQRDEAPVFEIVSQEEGELLARCTTASGTVMTVGIGDDWGRAQSGSPTIDDLRAMARSSRP